MKRRARQPGYRPAPRPPAHARYVRKLHPEPEPGKHIAIRTADLYRPTDELRGRRLSLIVKELGHCRLCESKVGDDALAAHPGICSSCWSRKRRAARLELSRSLELLRRTA